MLKSEHGLTHGFANMIALQALRSDSQTTTDTDSLVDAQYAGAKAALRPIYEAILAAVKKFGAGHRDLAEESLRQPAAQ